LSATAAIACAQGPGASAATIAVHGETAIFRAAPGEANDLDIIGCYWGPCGVGDRLVATDVGAPLTVGAGCEQLDANRAACPEDPDDYFYGHPLRVVAGDGDDQVHEHSDRREVTLRGGSGDDDMASETPTSKSPRLFGGQGDDRLLVANNGSGLVIMHGGPGDDYVTARNTPGGQLYGGGGDDTLAFPQWSDSTRWVDGGPGSDTYAFAYPPQDLAGAIAPGPGIDTLDASGYGYYGMHYDMRGCHGCVERIIGSSPGRDEITGDFNRQVIQGGDGPDVLRGGGGPDRLAGQDDWDTIYARDESVDIVSCGHGNDTVLADSSDVVAPNCEDVRRLRGAA
jgi:hypothetical protein